MGLFKFELTKYKIFSKSLRKWAQSYVFKVDEIIGLSFKFISI
jgi:hypothetical protein